MVTMVELSHEQGDIRYYEDGDTYTVIHVVQFDNGEHGLTISVGADDFSQLVAVHYEHPKTKILYSAPLGELLSALVDNNAGSG